MKEIFNWEQGKRPEIPSFHDSIIRSLTVEDRCIVMDFAVNEKNPDDAVRYYYPEAKSMKMRFHIPGSGKVDEADFYLLEFRNPLARIFHGDGYYKHLKFLKLQKIVEKSDPNRYQGCLEFGYTYVGFRSVILILFAGRRRIICEAETDWIEVEWG